MTVGNEGSNFTGKLKRLPTENNRNDWKRVDKLLEKLKFGYGTLYYSYENGDQIEFDLRSFDPLVIAPIQVKSKTDGSWAEKTIEEALEIELESKVDNADDEIAQLDISQRELDSRFERVRKERMMLND